MDISDWLVFLVAILAAVAIGVVIGLMPGTRQIAGYAIMAGWN